MSGDAALKAVNDYLSVLSQYRHGDDGPADPIKLAGGPAAERLGQAMKGQSPEVHAAVAARLAAGVAVLPDPLPAAVVAYHVGSIVEGGGDPVPLADALRTRLPADFAAAKRFVQLLAADAGIDRPDKADKAILARIGRQERIGASAWAGLQFSTPAAMAVWCRHRPSRLAARAVPGLVDDAAFLGDCGGYCYYIGELLSAADGTQLTVIAPEARKGFVVELEVVRNAAHLFALLEDTLVGDPDRGLLTGPRTDPKVAAIARGEGEALQGCFFNVGWHYEYWWGLQPEGAAGVSGLHPLVAAMIGVEATVQEIQAFRGQPVMLMRPGRFGSRACDIAFFAPLHDALRSRVTVVRQLPTAEVDSLCADLRAEAAKIG